MFYVLCAASLFGVRTREKHQDAQAGSFSSPGVQGLRACQEGFAVVISKLSWAPLTAEPVPVV